MNKKEKGKKIAKGKLNLDNSEDKVNYIVDIIAKTQSDLLYEVINETIFNERLAKHGDDKTYQKIYKKIYERVLWKLIKRGKE